MTDKLIIPKKLEEAIRNNKLVFFVGAGCSIPLGFPSWKDLTLNILKQLDEKHGESSHTHFKNIITELENNKCHALDALDEIGNDRQSGDQYKLESKHIINQEFEKIGSTNIQSPVHSLLWDITTKIFTTNYDNLLEIYKPSDTTIQVFENQNKFQSMRSQLDESQFLYKLHGGFDNPDTMVLFSSDYNDIYNNTNNHNEDTLRSFFKGKTFIFIGFSLTDPFINNLFEKIKNLYGGYLFAEHFILTTKKEDYSKYNTTTLIINDYGDDLIRYLSSLKLFKKSITSITNDISKSEQVSSVEDLNSLNELFKLKTEQLKANPSDINLYNQIKDIEAKIKTLLFGDFNYLQKISPAYKNVEIRSLFEKIYSSPVLDDQTIERITQIRNNLEEYNWYDRSVLVSSITCSLIHFNKADEIKISFLIDFINDNEEKVWEKAATSLFMVLNHLGNKWLRLNIKNKLKNLQEIPQIQKAFSLIFQLFNIGFHRISFLDDKIFANEYFNDSPFNYFLPFFDDKNNEGFISIFENYNGNIDSAINFLNKSKLPDQLKYLTCNSDILNKIDNDKDQNIERDETFEQVMHYNSLFYPFSIYVHELINFYKFFPKFQHTEKLKYQLTITETPIKEYLLNQVEKYKALGLHFMKEKKWGQAITNFKDAEKLSPNNIDVLLHLANCFNYNKYYDDELFTRLKIADIDESIEINIEGLFWHYSRKENTSKCIFYVDKLLDIDKNNSKYNRMKGIKLEELGDFKKSLNFITKAIKLDPKASDNFHSRAYLNLYLNNLDDAYEDLEMAEKLNHKKSDVLNCYANYYRLKNDIPKALECINTALESNDDAILLGTKAVIYSTNGEDDLFYEYLIKAINAGAAAHRLYPDIKEKYKNNPKFKEILEKYNQKLYPDVLDIH
jgi:tetratricopeptide (TPR) repeat protein